MQSQGDGLKSFSLDNKTVLRFVVELHVMYIKSTNPVILCVTVYLC